VIIFQSWTLQDWRDIRVKLVSKGFSQIRIKKIWGACKMVLWNRSKAVLGCKPYLSLDFASYILFFLYWEKAYRIRKDSEIYQKIDLGPSMTSQG
jgi:hypothetical protein